MKTIIGTDIIGSQLTEWTAGYTEDFPHVAYLFQLERLPEDQFSDCNQSDGSSWHWFGKSAGLAYVTEGAFEIVASSGRQLLKQGSGVLLNVNVLHSISLASGSEQAKMYVHLFDPLLIGGEAGSRIYQKYILPVLNDKKLEIFALDPDNMQQKKILDQLYESFALDNEQPEYEIKLRNSLSDIWFGLFQQIEPMLGQQKKENKSDEKVKRMMVYVYEHFDEKLSVSDIAAAAFVSVRECFRIFSSNLGTTPEIFVRDYRLRMACQMLSSTTDSVTTIGYNCGFRNNSYFCKIFRENIGVSPLAYRKKTRNN